MPKDLCRICTLFVCVFATVPAAARGAGAAPQDDPRARRTKLTFDPGQDLLPQVREFIRANYRYLPEAEREVCAQRVVAIASRPGVSEAARNWILKRYLPNVIGDYGDGVSRWAEAVREGGKEPDADVLREGYRLKFELAEASTAHLFAMPEIGEEARDKLKAQYAELAAAGVEALVQAFGPGSRSEVQAMADGVVTRFSSLVGTPERIFVYPLGAGEMEDVRQAIASLTSPREGTKRDGTRLDRKDLAFMHEAFASKVFPFKYRLLPEYRERLETLSDASRLWGEAAREGNAQRARERMREIAERLESKGSAGAPPSNQLVPADAPVPTPAAANTRGEPRSSTGTNAPFWYGLGLLSAVLVAVVATLRLRKS